jgi:hypothetical protein
MWGLMLSLVLQASAADCNLGSSESIQVIAPARGVVVLEMRLQGQAQPPTALLKVLTERGLPLTLLPSSSWAVRYGESLRGLAEQGHEVGYWLRPRTDLKLRGSITQAPSLTDWVRALREAKAQVERHTGSEVRTVGVHRLPEVTEKALEGLGFEVYLPTERTQNDRPRRSESLHSSSGRARVIGIGPYEDGCGPELPAWSPAALDRASRVAARADWVRIVLPPDPSAAPLLARWLDTVVLAEGWTVLTATQAGRRARDGRTSTVAAPPPQSARMVAEPTWTEVARRLSAAQTLPRQLPGKLTPTEAFLGLTQLLGSPGNPQVAALGPLRPPAEMARSSLGSTVTTLTEAEIRAAAAELLPGLSGQVPGFISVGAHTLTAGEFLRLMGRVYLGQSAIAQPINNPDPFAPGGGWGVSEGY